MKGGGGFQVKEDLFIDLRYAINSKEIHYHENPSKIINIVKNILGLNK